MTPPVRPWPAGSAAALFCLRQGCSTLAPSWCFCSSARPPHRSLHLISSGSPGLHRWSTASHAPPGPTPAGGGVFTEKLALGTIFKPRTPPPCDFWSRDLPSLFKLTDSLIFTCRLIPSFDFFLRADVLAGPVVTASLDRLISLTSPIPPPPSSQVASSGWGCPPCWTQMW